MKRIAYPRIIIFIIFILLITGQKVIAAQDVRFNCGGSVEAEVWSLWDMNIKEFLIQKQLSDRLLKQGDVYALYDFEVYSHNLISMAQRCKRTKRLSEIAKIVQMTYNALESGSPSSAGKRWVCRGGSICNEKNKLINTEVMLDSVQFLALASYVANCLVTNKALLSSEEKIFIRDTAQIAVEHLLRWREKSEWGDYKSEMDRLKKIYTAKTEDLKNGSPVFFFTDKLLWQMTIYAELAGILQANDRLNLDLIKFSDNDKRLLQSHFDMLLKIFSARISIRHQANSRVGRADLADIDRGYWQYLFDYRYAGYEKEDKPVACRYSEKDKTKYDIEIHIPVEKVERRQDTGWDFSHARRLVPALDSLARNRVAISDIWSLGQQQLPSKTLSKDFANTLIAVIWNGDRERPLFANFWSGANGWYRVAYDIGTNQCSEGIQPYGLTDSFPTGGYITWGRYNLTISILGRRIYDLVTSPDGESSSYIAKYFSGISKSASPQMKALTKIMFFPTLVGVSE
jgi:hypothetical protein